MRSLQTLGVIGLLALWVSGCGGKSEEEAMEAVHTAETIAKGIKSNQLHVVWDAWPDADRKDINEIVHRFAEKMPADVWERGFHVLGLWGQVLKEKRQFALNCPHLERGHQKLEQHGEKLSALWLRLAESDMGRLDKLKSADAGELMKSLDPFLMEAIPALFALMPHPEQEQFALESFRNALEKLISASFQLGKHGEDWAFVHSVDKNGTFTQQRFVKEGERWVIDFENDKSAFESAKNWIESFDAKSLGALAFVDGMLQVEELRLKKILEAKTQEEFDSQFADQADPLLPVLFFAADKKIMLPQ